MFTVTFEADFKNLKGKFAKADRSSRANIKSSITALSKRWNFLAKEEAPKKSGFFRQTITTEGFEEQNAIGFKGYSERPLGQWIIKGTAPHKIQAKNAPALYFFWPKIGMFVIVPKKGKGITETRKGKLIIGKGYVDHPGTKPNPFTQRALDRFVPEAKQALNRIAEQWVITFDGEQ